MVEKPYFAIPNTFLPFINSHKLAAFESLTTLAKPDFLIKMPYTTSKLEDSMGLFTKDLVQSGRFHELVTHYIKPDSNLKPERFSLRTHTGKRVGDTLDGFPDKFFYFESHFNLILVHGDPEEGACVTGGIDVRHGKGHHDSFDMTTMHPDSMLINQLQGPTYYKERATVKETFAGFRWERLFINIYMQWAAQAGVRNLYLLPSAYSRWEKVRNNETGGFHRYDITARKMGFRRKSDKEAYHLELPNHPKEVYNLLFEQQY